MNLSCPHAYNRESNMGETVGAPIQLKHNVPGPYHGPREISSMEPIKGRGGSVKKKKKKTQRGENREKIKRKKSRRGKRIDS
jgi:hypothetical protein